MSQPSPQPITPLTAPREVRFSPKNGIQSYASSGSECNTDDNNLVDIILNPKYTSVEPRFIKPRCNDPPVRPFKNKVP